MSTSLRPAPFILVACLAACAVDAQPTGHLTVPLVTTGPDGSAYRLAPGTRLVARSGQFFETFSLDGDTATIAIDLPAGEYELTLSHPGGYTTEWPLIRTDADNSETSVFGTLLTPMPMEVEVEANATASVVLSFRVATSGTVTFAHGSLAVSADVDAVEADGAFFHCSANEISVSEATIFPAAPEQLEAYWPSTGANGLAVQLFGVVGTWKLRSSSRVCAELELTANPLVTGHQGFADLVEEAHALPPGHADLCIETVGGTQLLEVAMARLGPPETATLMGLGQAEYLFVSRFTAELTEPVFDGETLDLGALDWTHGPFPMTGELEVDEVTPSENVPWYHAILEGNAMFRFDPTVE